MWKNESMSVSGGWKVSVKGEVLVVVHAKVATVCVRRIVSNVVGMLSVMCCQHGMRHWKRIICRGPGVGVFLFGFKFLSSVVPTRKVVRRNARSIFTGNVNGSCNVNGSAWSIFTSNVDGSVRSNFTGDVDGGGS